MLNFQNVLCVCVCVCVCLQVEFTCNAIRSFSVGFFGFDLCATTATWYYHFSAMQDARCVRARSFHFFISLSSFDSKFMDFSKLRPKVDLAKLPFRLSKLDLCCN